MPFLFCETHGRMHEAEHRSNQETLQQEGESVLIVSGKLISEPRCCDSCNVELMPGDTAYLLSALPGHVTEGLTDYDFGYERAYFAMGEQDIATVYGAPWPDDSISNRRRLRPLTRKTKKQPICALDLFRPK